MAAICHPRTLQAGKKAVIEGSNGSELFMMKIGTVEIEKRTLAGDAYTVTKLTAAMNAFFKEMALLDEDKRSATVSCVTDCEFLTINRDDFISPGNEHPATGLAITRAISRIVCQRLRKANTDIITLFDALVGEVSEREGLL